MSSRQADSIHRHLYDVDLRMLHILVTVAVDA